MRSLGLNFCFRFFKFLRWEIYLWECLWFLWWDDKDCCCHHGKYLWILKILVNIENIGEFGKYWKSCLNIENHGDYLWIPKIMANIENHGNYFWKLKIRVNTETHGKYLQLSFWQSRSMSLLEMYTDPQVFEIGGILTLFTFTSNLNMDLYFWRSITSSILI